MSLELIVRLIGLVIFGIIGVFLGEPLGNLIHEIWTASQISTTVYQVVTTLLVGLLGFLIAPWISIKPISAIHKYLSKVSVQTLVFGLIGLIVGAITAALLAYPISRLPAPLGNILPFVAQLLFGYLGIVIFVARQKDLENIFKSLGKGGSRGTDKSEDSGLKDSQRILVDTSAIIDGRIADIARTGFIPGRLLIPRFVLNELQYVSDSADNLRRQRGRRGMEVLSELQKDPAIPVTITDIDVEGVREVDERLIVLARQMSCPILTNDYNLNRVAELQGVSILNINELANAVKAILLPGESLDMKIIQEGKEYGQGVGYMEDGTMVVVENGHKFIGKNIQITVTKVLQTAAGRMIFAKPEQE
ncbi:MAG: TRAM domain-containing protein [Anaerolineaceae bacterium]|nr:TRAM domain-containing protein [Anaerolineaceae bacterium]